MSQSSTRRTPVTQARLGAPAALFVCLDCSKGSQRRRAFKHLVKAADRKRELRVVGCRCLDLCPRRGTTTLLARVNEPSRCAVVDDAADSGEALRLLLADQGVGDAVSD